MEGVPAHKYLLQCCTIPNTTNTCTLIKMGKIDANNFCWNFDSYQVVFCADWREPLNYVAYCFGGLYMASSRGNFEHTCVFYTYMSSVTSAGS